MSELRRRTTFWRNFEYELDHITENVESRKANKWCNADDLREIDEVKNSLFDGLKKVRRSYIEVLKEQMESED